MNARQFLCWFRQFPCCTTATSRCKRRPRRRARDGRRRCDSFAASPRAKDAVMTDDHVTEPSRNTKLLGRYEVVVLGGGPAGIAAALAAGRTGRSTLLIE